MCATCGCGETAKNHGHDHTHPHAHRHASVRLPATRTIRLEQDVLAKNDALAKINRTLFAEREIAAFNFVSSPGAGKTTLLEQTLRRIGKRLEMRAIEGDQETARDADRLRAAGCEVVQINTGAVCHLDAGMIAGGLRTLEPPARSLLLIENVGNLVCPAMFDLGERAKIVVMSVTEGDDKPLKYPHMFRASDVMVLNKLDLLPHVDFDVDACIAYARRANPKVRVFQVSARSGVGVDAWCEWLVGEVAR